LLAPSDVDAALPGAALLHLSGYTLLDQASRPAGRHALFAARQAGLRTSIDAASAAPLLTSPGFLDWVRGTDLLIANADEAQALVGSGSPEAQALNLAAFAGAAVLKLGPAGALWASTAGGVIHSPVEPAHVVDATGAGDAFAAGLLSAWLATGDPALALAEGCRLGAYAVTLVGARPPSSP
jgi:sugar/nucleoside kinase (ribokinase family)